MSKLLRTNFWQSRWWRFSLLMLGSLIVIMTIGLIQLPTLAIIDQATVKEIVDGDQVLIQENLAKVDDNATLGQQVQTKKARAGLVFNNGAAGRLGPDSLVTVGQCVEVKQGQIVVSGPVNGCISGFAVGVQGTIYTMQIDEKNPQEKATIKVLEGKVEVSKTDQPDANKVEVEAGKKVAISIANELGLPVPMTPEELVSLLTGPLFNGFKIPITPEGVLQSVCLKLVPQDLFSCNSSGIPTPRIPSVPSVPNVPSLPF